MKYSALQDEWKQIGEGSFSSPLVANAPEQVLVFSDQFKNGSIQVEITPEKGKRTGRGDEGKENAIVFRYSGYEGYYYAGLGAFNTKFFIGKVLPGPVWQLLGQTGRRSSIKNGQTYRLRVECVGNKITLFDNDVRQLVAYDDTYEIGQWGFRSWRSSARYENAVFAASKPICFVVMPFASELDFVYKVIKSTVEDYGFNCVRADEILISEPVVEDVKEKISGADLVIVDFTNKNPNVYYEAGLADAWKKKWIVIAQSSDDLTFDVRHIRTILYSNTMGADIQLREKLSGAIEETTGFRRLPDLWKAPA
ncbi:MAG: hypothetical protein JSW39_28255 [Desulfobacterales bacterium]|nr:MAG: hypothetical protein JSW39_28255 [Desulfobacterales bacterium]